MDESCSELGERGLVWVQDQFDCPDQAFRTATTLVEEAATARGVTQLSVVGDFVVPPVDGERTRHFQTLHFDFGLPLVPKVEGDVALYTALHVPVAVRNPTAVTRLVPLVALLAQRPWPSRSELSERVAAYGRSHGAWDDGLGYVEGSLARLVEATADDPPELPSVKTNTGFLCGMEFESLAAETAFFAARGLRVEEVCVEIAVQPGQLLIFDNLAYAHGRRGSRRPGELCQRAYGWRQLHVTAQRQIGEHVLAAFNGQTKPTDHASRPLKGPSGVRVDLALNPDQE